MLEQHEEERRRLSRELHDETAQVFSAVKMELELLRGQVPDIAALRLERLLGLVDKGIRGIRSVVNDLRPSLLDDLGLLPALRSLVADFSERSAIRITLDAPPGLPPLSKDAELAVFRALQEALSNVVRHANAKAVSVQITITRAGADARRSRRWQRSAYHRHGAARARGTHGIDWNARTSRGSRWQRRFEDGPVPARGWKFRSRLAAGEAA